MTKTEKKAITEVVQNEAKAKQIIAALDKAKRKSKAKSKAKSVSKKPRITIDSITLDLLRKNGGATLDQIVAHVLKTFPKHDKETLRATSRRRVKGYLQKRYSVTIAQSDSGHYRITSKASKASKASKNAKTVDKTVDKTVSSAA